MARDVFRGERRRCRMRGEEVGAEARGSKLAGLLMYRERLPGRRSRVAMAGDGARGKRAV